MKIMAIEKELPGATSEQFQMHLDDEALEVWRLYQAGVIRELYFRADHNTAVLVLECEDVTQAETLLTALPLVKAGLISFEVLPLQPYPGFARLFSSQTTAGNRL
jgi:muconolactone delta-isomerase